MSTENNTTPRIALMKSIKRRLDKNRKSHGSEKTDTRNKNAPTGLRNKEQKNSGSEGKKDIERNTDPHGKSPSRPENSTEKSAITTPPSQAIITSPATKRDAKPDTGKNIMKTEKGEDISESETNSENLPETKSGIVESQVEIGFQSMRQEIWKTLLAMKQGTLEPKHAREFSVGCNVILKTYQVEFATTGGGRGKKPMRTVRDE